MAAATNDAVDMDGQHLHGLSFAITDLQDASGNPLTNDTVILGLWISDRGGADPVGFFAVVPPAIQAQEPSPADGATDVRRDVALSWTSGETAKTHDVYFGTIFDDVNDASRTDPRNVLVSQGQDANMYDPDGLLEFGQIYYWRIDEVAVDGTAYKGDIWSFTVEPLAYPVSPIAAAASSSNNADTGPEKTIDGSGLNEHDQHSIDATDMWLSNIAGPAPAWIRYEFDRVYKLHEMWVWNSNQLVETAFGLGARDVTIEYSVDGVGWTILDDVVFNQATGVDTYTANTAVDPKGVGAKAIKLTINSNWGGLLPQYSLSEVRIFSIPTYAREPNPHSGATGVDPFVVLGWRAGREAASHDVYVGANPNALGLAGPVTRSSFDTASLALALGQSYYWRIDEVNDAETLTTWQGDLWSFSTKEFLVVDDFESYNDLNPDDPESNRIFLTWIGGDVDPANGSQVGNDTFPFAELTIVHGGDQSMPLFYDNSSASLSEVTVNTSDLAIGPDWTKGAPETLVLWFYGDPGNAATERMYVKVNGVKEIYPGDAADITRPIWKQWNVDLAALSIDLSNVTQFSIGFERTGASGGSGTVLIDDIRLYGSAPSMASEEIWLEAEAATTLGPSWRTYDDAGSSGGRHIGSEDGDGDDNNDPSGAEWVATYNFRVSGGVYKILARIITSPGNSFWVRIPNATSPQITRGDGWVNTNPMDAGDTWHWDEIHNDQQDDNVVYFTLSAGQQTLEIAKREDGAKLDAILITDQLD